MEPQEIIKFQLVLVDAKTLKQVDEFRTYVRPSFHPELTNSAKHSLESRKSILVMHGDIDICFVFCFVFFRGGWWKMSNLTVCDSHPSSFSAQKTHQGK